MKLKNLFQTDKQFNLFIAIFAFIAATVILFFNQHIFHNYEVDYKSINYNSYYESLFVEINESETKEIGLQKLNEQADLYAIHVYNLNDAIEEQTNIKTDGLWLKHFYYYDLNEDDYKDIIFIYHRNDSLFIGAIDSKNKKLLYYDEFLLMRGKERFAEKWDLTISIAGVEQNEFGEQEIFFSIWAGYSILPRGVYKFNFDTNELNKFEVGAAIHTLLFVNDINNKNRKILAITAAPGNTWRLNPKPQFDDFTSWLFFFDKKLNLLNYVEFEDEYSGFDFVSFYDNEDFFTLIKNRKNRNLSLENISYDGTLIKELFLDSLKAFRPLVNIKTSKQLFYLLADGELTGYNKELEKKISVINRHFRYDGHIIDIDFHGTTIFFYTDEEKFMLLDENFSQLNIYERKRNHHWYQIPPSYAIIGENKIQIAENGFNQRGKINVNYVSRFVLLPFYFVGLYSAILILLFIIKYFTIKTSTIFSYFINSTNRSSDAILILNTKKKIIYANKAASRKFNIKYSLWVGRKVDFVLVQNEEFNLLFNNALHKKRLPTKELPIVIRNRYVKMRCNTNPLFAPWGLVIAVYFRLEDISKEIYLERQKVLTHSVRKVAHEIKTPLASISLNLDSIEQNLDENNESISYDITIARQEIRKIRDFINNFLKFTNSQKPNFEYVNIEKVINNALLRFSAYMAHSINIEIIGDVNENVWCDQFQIEEVFQVFIENAIDAMEGKGKIIIECKKLEEQNKELLKISIKDFGCGIEDRIKNVLFDPYTTTKPHGTGMGMAIAKKILGDHDSKIEIKSEKGIGTEVSFILKINI